MNALTMTIPLPADLNALPEAKVHWLPCTIHSDQEASVDKYFLPQPVSPSLNDAGETTETAPASGEAPSIALKAESTHFRASFRGRRLEGQVPNMHDFSALLVETSEGVDQDQSEGEVDDSKMELDTTQHATSTLRLTPVARVVEPIVWDHDQLPLVHTSAVLKGLEWAWLSSAVHQPVSQVDDGAESALDG
ncbi:ribonuclease H2, subunit C, partial [Catenaria anguillulae PL171]